MLLHRAAGNRNGIVHSLCAAAADDTENSSVLKVDTVFRGAYFALAAVEIIPDIDISYCYRVIRCSACLAVAAVDSSVYRTACDLRGIGGCLAAAALSAVDVSFNVAVRDACGVGSDVSAALAAVYISVYLTAGDICCVLYRCSVCA